MGSCFKFTMCRKRAYDFQNQPYEPTVQSTEGRYRVSTADVEGWDPEVSLKVNGDAGEEKHQPLQQPPAVIETSVVASPSNSDVTFGETFKDANENNKEEDVKDKKKKEKSKKEKSKKEKSKKEKSKSKKKNKEKEESENAVNENVEKDHRIENDEDIEAKKDGDNIGDMDISNMETLPREERHNVTQSDQTTIESEQVTSVTTQELVTESYVIEKADDDDNHDNVSDRVPMEEGHIIEDGEGEGEKVEVEIREPLAADDRSTHSEDDQEKHNHIRTTLVTSNSHTDDIHDRKSSFSDSEMQRLGDVEDKGEDHHSIEGGAYPYPEPEEQIDVRNIRNLTDDMSLVTENSSTTIQEAEDGSAVTTITKVIVTETVGVDHAD